MALDIAQIESLVRSAAASLQRGDAAQARQSLEQVTATGRGNIQIWLLLALACKGTNDVAAEERAVDSALKIDSANIRALILKGDCCAAGKDPRGATSFYERAIGLAQGKQLPADLAREVERAEALSKAASAEYRTYLEEWIGRGPAIGGQRFRTALDIMFGDKQIYLQQPTIFYFPGLPQIQFYEREQFDWIAEVEAATDAMREELSELLATEEGFRPYLTTSADRPRTEFHGLNDNPEWSTMHLFENGGPVNVNVARAPRTYETLIKAPLCHITTRAPTIMFSLLRAGARIPAHTGQINTRLICHLPLIVPEGCAFRVGNEVREWEVGKTMIFDDTIEHEAWNEGPDDRVVVIFDIWRPELTLDERQAVVTMFEGIDRYGV
ncbi:aspartyl/asparaginyl beta-hydroxylase domain-containing protein [Sphingomonas sp.]|uniref:aspartyl/asparaginyl beta-hydroxylase domain-containing protein n=1 Tax=Sphingomonas sp. TaxID=28214 RepID=UPI000BCE3C84|nr:MAG: hypothetical protein B7Z43_08200 [Sphingomonas sp. 12-62-6]